jgi:hypothetical protein
MTYWTLITRTVITTKERLSFSSPGRNRSLVVLASDNSVSQWNYIKKTDDLYWTLNWPNEWCSSLSMPTSYKLWLLSLWLKRWNLHQPIRNVDHLNIIMFDSMKCNCSTICRLILSFLSICIHLRTETAVISRKKKRYTIQYVYLPTNRFVVIIKNILVHFLSFVRQESNIISETISSSSSSLVLNSIWNEKIHILWSLFGWFGYSFQVIKIILIFNTWILFNKGVHWLYHSSMIYVI